MLFRANGLRMSPSRFAQPADFFSPLGKLMKTGGRPVVHREQIEKFRVEMALSSFIHLTTDVSDFNW